MKFLRNWIYLGIIPVIFLAACAPGTPTITPTQTGLVNSNPIPFPNVVGTALNPALLAPCVPPVPAIADISSYCANPIKGVGGASFSDVTKYQTDTDSSWLVGDSIPGNVSCNLDNGKSEATCQGPQNGTFQATVCSSCGEYSGASGVSSFVCANGYIKDAQGNCNAIDAKKAYGFCPPGSHYDNAKQNCADNATNKLASPCPADHSIYAPYSHACWDKVEMAFNCQTFPITLGICPSANKLPVNVVPFCQNKGTNKGGANMTYEAGNSLLVDIKGSRLDGCTSDGNGLMTCWGAAGMKFNVQVCKDPAQPATCTTYEAVLGSCPVKENNPEPAAPTACAHC